MVTPADILSARILVVDDKEANVRLLEGMLRIAGYTAVQSTMKPREVCGLHRRNRYDLILLDLQMPDMDGFQVMEGLKTIEEDGYMPVLVITAQPDHKLRALEAGAKDFVSKPFDLAELRARVRNILEVRLYSEALTNTVRELEATREALRLKTLAEQRKIEQEAALAEETQKSLLPRTLPEIENFKIRAFNSPTRYVGGDFYDFAQLDRGQWIGVVADVSGKGMPAALLSSMVLGALSTEFHAGARPAEALSRVNRLVCEKSLDFQFVTIFLFQLGPDGAGEYISAGHNPACLYRSATGTIERLASRACFVGMFDTATWQTLLFQLNKGDILVVYSDGLTDATNSREEMFGEKRLLEMIRQHGPSGSHSIEQNLLRILEEFTESTPQPDDITFMIVEKL